MKILDRYIAVNIVGATLIVMLILLALFSFISFVTELGDVGRGQYGVLQAAEYVVLSLPRMAYQVLPLSALIGSMVGLGLMAANSELIVVRAAGISIGRVVVSVLRVAVLLLALGIVLGEVIAPISEQYAQNLRAVAMDGQASLRTATGYWVRDGDRYINIGDNLSEGQLLNIHIYDLDSDGRMTTVTRARQGIYAGHQQWDLLGVERSVIAEDGVQTQILSQLPVTTILTPELLERVTVKPEFMSTWALYRYIEYLHSQVLGAERYELAFWNKIVVPFATAVMVFLAVPFVFGSPRAIPVGQRIVVGVGLGMAFYLCDQIFGYIGLVYHANALLSAALPTVVFFLLGLFLLRRAR